MPEKIKWSAETILIKLKFSDWLADGELKNLGFFITRNRKKSWKLKIINYLLVEGKF